MAIELLPLPLPASADASKLAEFGREVKGINPAEITPEDFKEIEQALFKVCLSYSTPLPSSLLFEAARSSVI
jgi:hypothetical protein